MKKTSILLCLVMLLSLCGCGGTADKKTKEFFAMDTYMTLTAYGDNAEKALSEASGSTVCSMPRISTARFTGSTVKRSLRFPRKPHRCSKRLLISASSRTEYSTPRFTL